MCTSPRPAFVHLARCARQSGSGQHAVLAGDPSLASVAHELRHTLFHRGGTNHAGVAHFDQHRSFSSTDEIWNDIDRTHLVRRAIIRTIEHGKILAGESAWNFVCRVRQRAASTWHSAFSTLPGDGRAGVAAERRKNAAYGVSRGSD